LPTDEAAIADDVRTLHGLGYAQELLRRMSGFSNYAISLSIICTLAGGVTSFQQGLCSVGGASIGLGWPLGSLISLCFALTMAQVASAFPTAGGLYHWASILGGRGWGWITAWFNLAGLVTVLAAINVGAYQFAVGTFGPRLRYDVTQFEQATEVGIQIVAVLAITFSQALLNHRGIRVTTLLTDFSGWWILVVAVSLTAAMLLFADTIDPSRLVTFDNFSGLPEGDAAIWPRTDNVGWLFLLGLLLPAYTITGFDASAHTSEETIQASRNVPRGIVRSVAVSAVFGWLMLAAVVSAAPDLGAAAAQGANSFTAIVDAVAPQWCALTLYAGIVVAHYLCGLATLTSASRMCYAFARDGGLPFSHLLRRVSLTYRTPAIAIWCTATLTILFTVYTPVYSTIAAACVIFLYVSYLIPTVLGLFAYNRSWTKMGPWTIGGWYRPLAVLCVLGCGLLLVIGVQPPNEKNLWIIGGALAATALVWFGFERHHFSGPPQGVMIERRQAEIRAAEAAVGENIGIE
jgi:amino acid transporter